MTEEELNRVKFALKNLVGKQDFSPIYSFIELYSLDDDLKRIFFMLQFQYKDLEKKNIRGSLTKDEYKSGKAEVAHKFYVVINEIESKQLRDECLGDPLIDDENTELEENNAVTVIIEPKFDEWVGNIQEDVPDLRKPKTFKTLMRRCQDELAVGHYTFAYQICTFIRNEITTESYQVYEYMLFAYFHREGVQSIVEDAAKSKGNKIKHLIQFVKRYYNIESASKPQKNIPNIDWIAKELILEMRRYYKSIEKEYSFILNNSTPENRVLKPKKEEKENVLQPLIKQVWQLITWMQKVFDNFDKKVFFLHFVAKELSGCGIIQWINIDSKWNTPNAQIGYNGVEAFNTLVSQVKELGEGYENPNKELGKIIYSFWQRKYNKIANIGREEEKQKAIIRCIQVGLIAYNKTREQNFLKKIVEEFEGNNAAIWYYLTFGGELMIYEWVASEWKDFEHHLKRILRILKIQEDEFLSKIKQSTLERKILQKVDKDNSYQQALKGLDYQSMFDYYEYLAEVYSILNAISPLTEENKYTFKKVQTECTKTFFEELYQCNTTFCWFTINDKNELKTATKIKLHGIDVSERIISIIEKLPHDWEREYFSVLNFQAERKFRNIFQSQNPRQAGARN